MTNIACRQDRSSGADGSWLLVRGGTIVDVTDFGRRGKDLTDAFVLIHGDTIVEAGQGRPVTSFPVNTRILYATGKYLLPGLIDGFGTLNNQAYANAYLYMGVTTLLEVDGGRRDDFFAAANPAPNIYHLEGIGEETGSTEVFLAQLDSLHEAGYQVVLLMYGLQPEQLDTLVQRAHVLGMNCIGELGHPTYREAMAAGVETFVHFTRYSLELAPRDMMTYLTLMRTDIFRAAVVGGGLSDLFMMMTSRPDMEEVYYDVIPNITKKCPARYACGSTASSKAMPRCPTCNSTGNNRYEEKKEQGIPRAAGRIILPQKNSEHGYRTERKIC